MQQTERQRDSSSPIVSQLYDLKKGNWNVQVATNDVGQFLEGRFERLEKKNPDTCIIFLRPRAISFTDATRRKSGTRDEEESIGWGAGRRSKWQESARSDWNIVGQFSDSVHSLGQILCLWCTYARTYAEYAIRILHTHSRSSVIYILKHFRSSFRFHEPLPPLFYIRSRLESFLTLR